MAEKPKGISQDTAEAYALLGIPYEGFVEGCGYQSLMAQTLGNCYFQPRGCAVPQFVPVMDSSPEMRIQSVGYQHKVQTGDTLTSISKYYGERRTGMEYFQTSINQGLTHQQFN